MILTKSETMMRAISHCSARTCKFSVLRCHLKDAWGCFGGNWPFPLIDDKKEKKRKESDYSNFSYSSLFMYYC